MTKKKELPEGYVIARSAPLARVRKRISNALANANGKADKHNERVKRWGGHGEITGQDLIDAMETQEHRCWYCQCELDPYNWHTDHRVPLCRDGNNIPGNIVITCPSCNLKKSKFYPHEKGWRLL